MSWANIENKCKECGGTGRITLLTSSEPCPKCSIEGALREATKGGKWISCYFKWPNLEDLDDSPVPVSHGMQDAISDFWTLDSEPDSDFGKD
jgi:hypothetical protein